MFGQKIDGKFELESDARFGQFVFENGGIADGYELVGDNVSLTDSRDNYCGTDVIKIEFYEDWAEQFVEKLNFVNCLDKFFWKQ